MSQELKIKLKGLYLAPNNLGAVPDGALQVAENVVLDYPSLVTSRRGFNFFAGTLSGIDKMFAFNSNLLVHYDTDVFAYLSGTTWVPYGTNVSDPGTGYKIQSLNANRNFYFTTNGGVLKIDAIASEPITAGAPRALDNQVATSASATGFLANNSAVGYQVLWGYRDANDNIILGAPSSTAVLVNTSGAAVNGSVIIPIPSGVTVDWFYQIYRSSAVASTVTPSPEVQLVQEGQPTSSEITAGTLTFVDTRGESFRGATLYTSPSQEGAENANFRPPFAKDLALFNNHTFYGNTSLAQAVEIDLTSTLAVTGATPVANRFFLHYEAQTIGITNTSTTIVVPDITAAGCLLKVGMRVVCTGVPANAVINSFPTSTSAIISAAATATNPAAAAVFQDFFQIDAVKVWAASAENAATDSFLCQTSGTVSENLAATSASIVRAINEASGVVDAYLIDDIVPGKMQFVYAAFNTSAFSAFSTGSRSFTPNLPTNATDPAIQITSESETTPHRVYISKSGLPEAVPLYRFLDVGSANYPIRRLIALRDSLLVLKDDGIFRITGTDISSFAVSLLDNTAIIKVSESAVSLNNQCMCFTSQGIVAISDNGVQVVSYPIENELLRISSSLFPLFPTVSFGVAYESDRKYIFFTLDTTADTHPVRAFVYNTFTEAWTEWVFEATCGLVSPGDNKLYYGNPVEGYVFQERKNYTATDFADRSYAVTINIASFNLISVTSTANLVVGMTLIQGANRATITEIQNANIMIIDKSTLTWSLGAATVYAPIETLVQLAPITGENPGLLKQFAETTLFFKDATFDDLDVGVTTNFSQTVTTTTLTSPQPTGGELALRMFIPLEKQRGSWLTLQLGTQLATVSFSFEGLSIIYYPMSSRFR